MDYDLQGFGKKLKAIRMENGLRQKDVSDLVGINRDTLRKLENGQSLPKIDTLDQLGYVYKQDVYKLFSNYRINVDYYVTQKMKAILPHFRSYNYRQIVEEVDAFYETFKASKYYSNSYIQKKMKQFKIYLLAFANLDNSFKDQGREAITELFISLGYGQHDIKNKMVRLDKLEIRILIMLSTIYRYRDEFISSQDLLETALYEITTYYREDQEFLYFYTLIVMNLMTYYHRQDQYSALDGLYKEALQVLDESLSLHNFAYMMIRIGINKHYMADMYSDDFVNVGLALLRDYTFKDKYEKHHATLKTMYGFLNLKDEQKTK